MRRAHVGLAAALALGIVAGCTVGRRATNGLRVTLTEAEGDLQLTLPEPIRAVTCLVRDHRRDPNARDATAVMWAARCAADCLQTVRYGDRMLTATTAARPLAPSPPGTCYECVVQGATGSGLVRFRTGAGGGFEACAPRVGNL